MQCYLYRTTSSLLFVVNVVYILKSHEYTKTFVDLTWRLGYIKPNSLRIRAYRAQRWELPIQISFQYTYFLLYFAKTKTNPFLILHCTRNPNIEGNQTLLPFSLSLSLVNYNFGWTEIWKHDNGANHPNDRIKADPSDAYHKFWG